MNQAEVFAEKINELYTQGVHVGKIVEQDRNKTAILDCAIPRTIFDDKKEERYVKFLHLKDIGRVSINKDSKIVFATASDLVRTRLQEAVKEIRIRTEQVVLNAIYDKLSKIAMVRTTLNPIYVILKRVYEGGLLKSSLATLGSKREKYEEYLQFLCEINILREQKDKYSEGNHFIELRKALNHKDEETVLNTIFGLTIRDGKTYLLNNLHFNVLKPFIRISNVYYYSSALVDNLLYLKKSTLLEKYRNIYDINVMQFKFDSQIDQLNRAGILDEQEYISGKKEILADVVKDFKAFSR